MPARSSLRPPPFGLHAIALVALGVVAACSKESAAPPAPVAAASDAAASDAMAPMQAPMQAPDAVATQAPQQPMPRAPVQVQAPARAPERVAANDDSSANAPLEYAPPAAGYANESTYANAPVYADDPGYADDDQQQVVSVYVDPPLEQPAPVVVD